MNIPDKAIDAAQEFAYHHLGHEITALDVQKIIEAAAPYIAAQALRDYADELASKAPSLAGASERVRRDLRVQGLRARADKVEGKA